MAITHPQQLPPAAAEWQSRAEHHLRVTTAAADPHARPPSLPPPLTSLRDPPPTAAPAPDVGGAAAATSAPLIIIAHHRHARARMPGHVDMDIGRRTAAGNPFVLADDGDAVARDACCAAHAALLDCSECDCTPSCGSAPRHVATLWRRGGTDLVVDARFDSASRGCRHDTGARERWIADAATLLRSGSRLRLICSCAPLPCHGVALARRVLARAGCDSQSWQLGGAPDAAHARPPDAPPPETCLALVCACDPPLVYIPSPGMCFGAPSPGGERRGRRARAVQLAAEWAATFDVHDGCVFLAGELYARGERCGAGVADATLVIAIAPAAAPALPAATDPQALVTWWHGARRGVWTTAAAITAAAPRIGGAGARVLMRVVTAAAWSVTARQRPSPAAPDYLRVGALPTAAAVATPGRSGAASSPTAATPAALMSGAAAEVAQLRAAMVSAAGRTPSSFGDFCRELLPAIRCEPHESLPQQLLHTPLPTPPGDLIAMPFWHRAQACTAATATAPLHEPTPAAAPPGGWWPHDIFDILQRWCVHEIRAWLTAMDVWHASGGPRPHAVAFGRDAWRPRAWGYPWDLRGGPGNIRLLSAAREPRRTCVHVDRLDALLPGCFDRALVSMMRYGVRFEAHLDHQIVLMPNLLSMYTDIRAAAVQAGAMVAAGWVGLFDCGDIPCVPFRCVPRGIVDKHGTDEKRGVGDQGQPRKLLYTAPSTGGQPERVYAMNPMSRANGDWAHEDKDSLQMAAFNGTILYVLAPLARQHIVELAFDFSKFFHRLFYHVLELWQMGALVPVLDSLGHVSAALRLAIEYVMTMGATAASQIAQRLANELVRRMHDLMHAAEAAALADGAEAPYPPALTEAMRARAALPHDSFGTMARLWDQSMFTDDMSAKVIGAGRSMRWLLCFHELVGDEIVRDGLVGAARGLNLPLSRAAKQQGGVGTTWLGAGSAAALGVVWVPEEKRLRAAAGVELALAGGITIGEYRPLVHFLTSIHFMVGADRSLLHHIFRPLSGGADANPDDVATVDGLTRAVLERWRIVITNCSGAPALAALRTPAAVDPAAARFRVWTDAAILDTPQPGMGAWVYGNSWAVPIAACAGLELFDIPHLEFTAGGVGLLQAAPDVPDGMPVELCIDALASAYSLTDRARSPIMQAILDALLAQPLYILLAPRLLVSHIFGEGQAGDAPSRGYYEQLAAFNAALGLAGGEHRGLSAAAQAFLALAVEQVARVRSLSPAERGTGKTVRMHADGDGPPPSPPPTPPRVGGVRKASRRGAAPGSPPSTPPSGWRAASIVG